MASDSQANRQRYGKLPGPVTRWSPPLAIQELAREETGLVPELIESFTQDMQYRLQRIWEAVNSSNALMLRREVHAVKGSSKQMAADWVASVCEQIEAAERERPISQLADLIKQLEARVREVCDAMGLYRLAEEKKAS